MPPRAARFLEASVRAGLNILVAGGTQAGKTTMLNCLSAAIPGGERVVSVEEVFELRFPHPDWVPMQTRQAGLEGTGEITLRELVKESLRMRPSRLLVGEVRSEECMDLLLALNAGLPGMCTIHANSAREALVKMCTLPLLAGENISARFVVPTVASSVDLVVHLGIDEQGVRRVREIVSVPGRVEADVIETEAIFERPATSCGGPPGCRRGSTASRGSASTSTRSWRVLADGGAGRARGRHRTDAGVVGVLPAPPAATCAADPAGCGARWWPAGLGGVSTAGFVVLCLVLGLAAGLLVQLRLADHAGGALLRGAGGEPAGDRRVRPRAPAYPRAGRPVARGRRQPRVRGPGRAVAAGGARQPRHPRPGAAARPRSARSRPTTS